MLFEIISKETSYIFKKVEAETVEGAESLFSQWLNENVQPKGRERFVLKHNEKYD